MRDWIPRFKLFGRAMSQADYLRKATDEGDLDWAKDLLERGTPAEPAEASSSPPSSSPLFLAARGGHGPLVTLLTAHGADPARSGPDGTPLMAACACNSAECVSALMSAAAAAAAAAAAGLTPAEAKAALASARHPKSQETALHIAARAGAADAARALLDAVGSSVGCGKGSSGSAAEAAASAAAARSALCWSRDTRGRTPAVAAGAAPCGGASIEMMALLLAAVTSAGGAGTTSSKGDSSAASAAAPAGADTTALHLAAARGNGPLCSALLAACGARAALRHDARGALPLHLAVRCGRSEAAGILARAMGREGVRSARDAKTGAGPLHELALSLLAPSSASSAGGGGGSKAAMARLLIEAGADPSARDNQGKLASDHDASVLPPVELEAGGAGDAASRERETMAATAAAARALLVQLRAEEEEEEAAAAGARARALEVVAEEEEGKGDVAAAVAAAFAAVVAKAEADEAAAAELEEAETVDASAAARIVIAAASAPSAKAIALKQALHAALSEEEGEDDDEGDDGEGDDEAAVGGKVATAGGGARTGGGGGAAWRIEAS